MGAIGQFEDTPLYAFAPNNNVSKHLPFLPNHSKPVALFTPKTLNTRSFGAW